MRNVFAAFGMAITCLALGACSANYNTAFRDVTIDPLPNALVVDAKQRAILSANLPVDSSGNVLRAEARRFCSEPSPDVFSVIAQALGAGGSFSQGADPASIEAALNLAFSTSEQGSTIPRTQTVNMLREMMFRTCERYLSGGYDATELSIQAARDQRIMVSILAIEQLTGAVTPRPVVLGATGSAGSGVTGEAIVRLDTARKARDDARTAYAAALEAYNEVNSEDSVCDAIEGKDEDDLTDAQKAKVQPCTEKRTARDAALTKRNETQAAYAELSTLASTGGVGATTSVAATAPGGIDRASTESVTAVAATVQAIVGMNFSDSTETLLFCQRMLREKPSNMAPGDYSAVTQQCSTFLQQFVENEGQRLSLLTEQIATATNRQTTLSDDRFLQFWRVNSGSFATRTGRDQIANRVASLLGLGDAGKDACFRTAETEAVARTCFNALPNRVTALLIQGGS